MKDCHQLILLLLCMLSASPCFSNSVGLCRQHFVLRSQRKSKSCSKQSCSLRFKKDFFVELQEDLFFFTHETKQLSGKAPKEKIRKTSIRIMMKSNGFDQDVITQLEQLPCDEVYIQEGYCKVGPSKLIFYHPLIHLNIFPNFSLVIIV